VRRNQAERRRFIPPITSQRRQPHHLRAADAKSSVSAAILFPSRSEYVSGSFIIVSQKTGSEPTSPKVAAEDQPFPVGPSRTAGEPEVNGAGVKPEEE